MVPSERSSSDLSEHTLFEIKNICFSIKIKFLSEKCNFLGFFLHFFPIYFQSSSDFINSNVCIGKITSVSIRMYPVFIYKRNEFNKTRDYF